MKRTKSIFGCCPFLLRTVLLCPRLRRPFLFRPFLLCSSLFRPLLLCPFLFCFLLTVLRVTAQPELEPWGNITGIRVDGHLMEFESSLRLTSVDGHTLFTGKEMQNPHYARQGKTQIITTHLDSLYFKEAVEEKESGSAGVTVSWTANADMKLKGSWFSITLPEELTEKGTVQFIDPLPTLLNKLETSNALFSNTATGIKIISPHRQIEIRLEQPLLITGTIVQQAGRRHCRIDIMIQTGELQKGQTGKINLSISTGGDIDRDPIQLNLNTNKPGRAFDGLGGNFRIQNTRLDPQVIAYCLEHLRVAWGRVEMPWRFWQPNKDSHPLDSARAGQLHPAVQRAMEMARTLSKKGIPIILSAWFPPDWAAEGPLHFRPGPDHIWGNPLNKANMDAIYQSIADYIVFLKQQYKVDIKFFSFNESDLGINVRQTAQEHDELIKGLGAYFATRGLTTKVLLGDNSDATTWSFIGDAMKDPAARPYMGAVSFHSWRGWDTATLQKWTDAATALHLPLLVGEGSIDAAAWAYPQIFLEPTYALKEISLYTLLLGVCQPASILQWQLTSDYSPLVGGGLFGDTSELRPTQRFWNLQQLSMTPKGLFAMPFTCDRPNITLAALGNTQKYVMHLVNNGATREATLNGLPAKVRRLRVYTTNQQLAVKEGAPIAVSNGQAKFSLTAQSYITLISE